MENEIILVYIHLKLLLTLSSFIVNCESDAIFNDMLVIAIPPSF